MVRSRLAIYFNEKKNRKSIQNEKEEGEEDEGENTIRKRRKLTKTRATNGKKKRQPEKLSA